MSVGTPLSLFVAVLRLLRFLTSTHCPSPTPLTLTLTPTPSSHITMSAARQFFVGGNFKVCPPDHQPLARPARLFAPPHHARRQAERSCPVFALPPHRLLSAPDDIPQMNPTVRPSSLWSRLPASRCSGDLTADDLVFFLTQSWKACTQLLDGLLAAEIDSKTGKSLSLLVRTSIGRPLTRGTPSPSLPFLRTAPPSSRDH